MTVIAGEPDALFSVRDAKGNRLAWIDLEGGFHCFDRAGMIQELRKYAQKAGSAGHSMKPGLRDPTRYALFWQRFHILQRDGYRCRYCRSELTNETAVMDHVIPWGKGGRTVVTNMVASCRPCNRSKLNKATKPLPVDGLMAVARDTLTQTGDEPVRRRRKRRPKASGTQAVVSAH